MIEMPSVRLSDINPASWYYAGGMGPCCWRHLGVPGPWPVQGERIRNLSFFDSFFLQYAMILLQSHQVCPTIKPKRDS